MALLPERMLHITPQALEQGKLVGKPGFSEGQKQRMPPENQALCEPRPLALETRVSFSCSLSQESK